MFESLQRIFKTAFASFWRNGWLSTATILVMSLALFVFGGLLLSSVVMNVIFDDLQKKIDISVYFKLNTPENIITDLQLEFQKIPDVREVSYVSQAEALEVFRTSHKSDPVIQETLNELKGENPFPASLNISASDATKLAQITAAIEARHESTVEEVNFKENEGAIAKLTRIMAAARTTGAVLAAILAFIAVVVAFNTVRLAIYTSREEINVMRLVGASAWYIRGPFLIEGILDGIISAVITVIVFFPITAFISPKINDYMGGSIDIFQYFRAHFGEFFSLILATAVILGLASSFLAVRRYLKV